MITLRHILDATGGTLLPYGTRAEQRARAVAIDSRTVQPGEIFFALRGERADGNDFVAEAIARGAAGAVVDRAVDPPGGSWVVRVGDVRRALWQLAGFRRAAFGGVVVAVTGSVGKTTTREMIHAVLGHRMLGSASPGNFNNELGLPLAMLAMEAEHHYAALELGASRRGDIARLSSLCAPTIGVITTLAESHLASFGSRENIAAAKAELLATLPAAGLAVLVDDPLLRRASRFCSAPAAWIGPDSLDGRAVAEVSVGAGELRFTFDRQAFRVPIWGRHFLGAALAAIAVARHLGFPLAEIAAGLARFHPAAMRCQVERVGAVHIINDAYNANPASMRAALALLAELPAERRLAVLGAMAELGSPADRRHAELGREAIEVGRADVVIACGAHAETVAAAARSAGAPVALAVASAAEAAAAVVAEVRRGDAVLVKGSRTATMERVAEAVAAEAERGQVAPRPKRVRKRGTTQAM